MHSDCIGTYSINPDMQLQLWVYLAMTYSMLIELIYRVDEVAQAIHELKPNPVQL